MWSQLQLPPSLWTWNHVPITVWMSGNFAPFCSQGFIPSFIPTPKFSQVVFPFPSKSHWLFPFSSAAILSIPLVVCIATAVHSQFLGTVMLIVSCVRPAMQKTRLPAYDVTGIHNTLCVTWNSFGKSKLLYLQNDCLRQTGQVAQLSQRDRAAGLVSSGQKWKTGTEKQYLRTMWVSIQPLRRIWPAKKSKSAKKRKIRAVTPFKVIQGHPRSSRSVPIESPYATSY